MLLMGIILIYPPSIASPVGLNELIHVSKKYA